MPRNRLQAAAELQADVLAALTAAGMAGQNVANPVHVTLDARTIESAARGRGAVLIQPPTLEFETWAATTATWELVVIAGPADNPLAAWAAIDPIIAALEVSALPIKTGTPAEFAPVHGPVLPAYAITTQPLD
jgi:hypothetical protein